VGIDTRLETERSERLAEVLDWHNHLAWLLRLADDEETICLRFIDPYGDAIFNGLQLPVLLAELTRASANLSEDRLEFTKQQYLADSVSWPDLARQQAQVYCEGLTLSAVREHCDKVIALVGAALERGPHHYVRFVGD
jgi:hypothetical protein